MHENWVYFWTTRSRYNLSCIGTVRLVGWLYFAYILHKQNYKVKVNHKGANHMLKPHMETTGRVFCDHVLPYRVEWASAWTFSGYSHIVMVPSPFLVNGPSLVVRLLLSVLFLWLSTHQSLQRKDVACSVSSKPQFWVCSLADIGPHLLSHIWLLLKRMLANAENMNTGTMLSFWNKLNWKLVCCDRLNIMWCLGMHNICYQLSANIMGYCKDYNILYWFNIT